MRLLLDSHTLIWAADEPAKVSAPAMSLMTNAANELLISAVTIWEIAIKVGKGRLPPSLPYRLWMDKAVSDLGLKVLPITVADAEQQVGLPFHHRDPFDRMLAAQALVQAIPLVSADPIFDAYSVNRIWS
ncbi:MAG: type II toxin-antitoxin system VapC family toxin [Gemmataceae bacterium]|nr:type II toxin-antitoxin system VapC family toxin [Gemmataceae bacterium]